MLPTLHRTLVDLDLLEWGGAPIEIAPAGNPVYAILLRSLTTQQMPPLALRLGTSLDHSALLTVRGQGDRFRFPIPVTSGLSLGFAVRRPSLPANLSYFNGGVASLPGAALVEVLVSYGPEIDFSLLEPDPWASASHYTLGHTRTPAAGQRAALALVNATNYQDLNATAGRLQRVTITSSIDGTVDIRRDPTSAAGAISGVARQVVASVAATRAPEFGHLTGDVALPLGEAVSSALLGCPAGVPITWEAVEELLPRPTAGGQYPAIAVTGPVDATLWVTWDWKEVNLQ